MFEQVSALSNSVVGRENYPGKVDIKNVNGLGKNISSDLFAGSMTFRYPLVFPKGVRSMSPEIALSYNSSNSDAFSPYGYGFSLSIPRIQRSAKKWVSELYTTDEYSAFGNDLIKTAPMTYKSKDANDVNTYTLSWSGWVVRFPDGRTQIYGATPTSRIANSEETEKIYAWSLSEERDIWGNKIEYSYILDGGQPLLKEVRYGFDSSWTPLYRIIFDYIPKKASLVSYRTQFGVETKSLLSTITLKVTWDTRERWYRFLYDSPDTPVSHLVSIEEFALSDALPKMTFTYWEAQYIHSIIGIDNGRGGKATFEYTPSTTYRNGSGDLLSTIPFIVQTLSKSRLEDTITWVKTEESHTYENGHYYYDSSDIWGREYVGFGKVTTTDTDSREVLYFHQSQTAPSAPGKYQDHIMKKWRLYKKEIYDRFSWVLLSSEYTRYDMRSFSGERKLVFPSYRTESVYASDGSRANVGYEYQVDDDGNITKETRLGDITITSSWWEYTDIPGDSIVIEKSYFSNTWAGLSRFLASEKISGSGGAVLKWTEYHYDGLMTWVTAWLMTEKIEKNTITPSQRKEQFAYDTRGLLTSRTDPLGNTTTSNYDPRGIALTMSTNPLWWVTSYVYDFFLGKPRSTTDHNGVITRISYDNFGRERDSSIDSGNSEITLSRTTYVDTIPNNVKQEVYFDTGMIDKKITLSYQDGFGRTLSTITSTEKPGQWSQTDVRYDDEGNPIFASYPVWRSTDNFDPTFLIIRWETSGEAYRAIANGVSYTYDALGRITRQKDARGTTTKSYTLRKEIITDAMGNMTSYEKDAYGNLVSTKESLGWRTLTTTYTYDLLGRPTTLLDTLGNTRSWSYDGYGRLERATDLHSPWDTTYGERSYSYDTMDRPTLYTNANNETINYSYDVLGRLTTEAYSWVTRSYSYDAWSRSLGRLTSVAGPEWTVSYTYDPLGRKTQEIRTIDGTSYSLSYNYSIQNLLTLIRYPNLSETQYLYKKWYIEWVKYTTPTGTTHAIISDITYTPTGTMASVRYGNGVIKNTERDPWYNYRLSRVRADLSGSTLLDTSYSYDPLSNITGINVDGLDPLRKTVSYSYDELSRLTNASYNYSVSWYGRSQSQSMSYTYDDIGNITNASPVGAYIYGGASFANPHAVVQDSTAHYTYDAAGNMIERNGRWALHTFSYSPYAEMLTSETSWQKTDYTYDHTRRRLTKTTLGAYEHHVIDGYEIEYESGALVPVSLISWSWTTETPPLDGSGMLLSGSLEYSIIENPSESPGFTWSLEMSWATYGSWALSDLSWVAFTGSTETWATIFPPTISGSTDTGSLIFTGSVGIIDDPTQTGEIYTVEMPTLSSEETISIEPIHESQEWEKYIVIASYYAVSASGATPVTLKTTLTHIMLWDEVIATFQSQTDDTPYTSDDDKLIYHIADHLNSSSLDLSVTGSLLQVTDYQPFGKTITYEVMTTRVKGKKWWYKNKYLFAGKQLDEESGLQYFEKRYYDPVIGRFTTEDPVFWEVSLTKRPSQYFTDPQQWNSYSYVRNNPINMVDPTGEFVMALPFVAWALWFESVSATIICASTCTTTFTAITAVWAVVLASYVSSSYYKALEWLGGQIYDLTHKAEETTVTESTPSIAPQAETTGTASPPPWNGGGNRDGNKKPSKEEKINPKEKAANLIRWDLKKSPSYSSELANKTYEEIVRMAKEGTKKAQQMKKLIEQSSRLWEKTSQKWWRK